MKLGSIVTRDGKEYTIVGILGKLTVLKEGKDVTNSNAFLLLEFLESVLIPTNITVYSPYVAQVPGGIVFCGVTFPVVYGPYTESNAQNFVISFQGVEYKFEVAQKQGRLISVTPR